MNMAPSSAPAFASYPSLQDASVVVTGGASGIGLATARRFATEGARVAIWDVAEGAGRAAAERLAGGGVQAVFTRVDVTSADSVERGFEDVISRWGSLSVLVNNAGILRDAQLVKWKEGAPAGRMEEADFDAVISVNLKGVFLCARAAVPHLIRAGGGKVSNGCVRMLPEDQVKMDGITLGTPVDIVA